MMIFQPDRHLLKQFIAAHAQRFSGVVLDVGGGNRRYSHLFRHCTSYKVLDVNPADTPDIVASVESIPLPDASVDGIICSQVLGDVLDTKKAISEMTRILKPGGLLLTTESFINEQHDEPHDYWRFTEFAWRALLAESFTIDVLAPRGGFYTQRAQNQIRYRIEKHRLYQHPILGRIAHIWATLIGRYALLRDRIDTSSVNSKFPIGYNILARKK